MAGLSGGRDAVEDPAELLFDPARLTGADSGSRRAGAAFSDPTDSTLADVDRDFGLRPRFFGTDSSAAFAVASTDGLLKDSVSFGVILVVDSAGFFSGSTASGKLFDSFKVNFTGFLGSGSGIFSLMTAGPLRGLVLLLFDPLPSSTLSALASLWFFLGDRPMITLLRSLAYLLVKFALKTR